MYDKNNIFAKILRGEIPCDLVFENEFAIAFRDLHPRAPTHVLVIPRGEYENLLEFQTHASAAERGAFWDAVRVVAAPLKSYQCVANTGVPYQDVFHFHLHVMGA